MLDSAASFVPYYNKYKNKVYVYLLYHVGFNRSVAEDLTSEVFLKAFQNFGTFDRGRSFQSWIYAIAHNHLVNHYRASKPEATLDQAENVGHREDSKLEARYELARVQAVIERMDVTDREILLLRYLNDLSNTEIAQTLGKDEGAVRPQISRSLLKLRQLLNTHG